MQIRHVLFVIGFLVSCIALFLLLPMGISLLYGEYTVLLKFSYCLGIALFSGLSCAFIFRPDLDKQLKLTTREGVAVVSFSWIFSTIISALPYYFIANVSPAEAFFEAASGLSTTGASIFTQIEALPKGLLFWRSLTQWLGGLGIIVFSLALLPFLGAGGMQLYKAEVSGVTKSKIAPRMVDTARSLWIIYTSLTIILWILLYFQGMSSFDAINHAFTTLSTGGFSTKNSSLAGFSPSIQWTIIIFMFLAGINFTLHYLMLFQGFKPYKENEECVYYTLIALIAICISTAVLYFSSTQAQSLLNEAPVDFNVERALRESSMHVISIITTTGFSSSDYLQWPLVLQGLLLVLTFSGACAGSTTGGIKIMRSVLSFKVIANELNRLSHPHAIERVKINKASVTPEVLRGVIIFIVIYLIANLFGTVVLLAFGYDAVTSFSATLTSIANVGPGFGAIGPAFNFSFMHDYALIFLSGLMIFGRLELFTILLLFTPKFWRR